ncbi:MAG TPA: 6-phosphogluconolactonase, partial [Bacteroidota bacterium]|nr:6-phosphogluconolactonase [Bacteroidota bacterium]
VSVTLPVINSAREVLFLVSGASKKEIVRRVFGSSGPDPEIPATLVHPTPQEPHWMLDADAGGSVKP